MSGHKLIAEPGMPTVEVSEREDGRVHFGYYPDGNLLVLEKHEDNKGFVFVHGNNWKKKDAMAIAMALYNYCKENLEDQEPGYYEHREMEIQ